MYILNHYYPFIHDDYLYSFIYKEGLSSNIRINSIKDVLVSQLDHYNTVNGRFPTHIIIQSFAGILGKPVFDILSSFIFVILCVSVSKLITNRYSLFVIIIVFMLFLFDLPYPGQTVFWMSGAINYLWATTFSLVILYKFYFGIIPNKNYQILGWLIFALMAGWMNESVSIIMSVGLFIYSVLNYKQISLFQKMVVVCYCLGCGLICFSPGTFHRINHGGDIQETTSIISFLFTRTWNMLLYFYNHPVSFVVLVITLLIPFFKKKQLYQIIKKEDIFIYLFIVATIFHWSLNISEERIYFFYNIISWILLFRYLYDTKLKNKLFKYRNVIATILLLCFGCGISNAYQSIKSYHDYTNINLDRIVNSPSKCVLKYIPYKEDINRYIYFTDIPYNAGGIMLKPLQIIMGRNIWYMCQKKFGIL